MLTSRILPIAALLLAVQIGLSHQKSSNYGQACSASERCNPARGTVSCNSDSLKCECADPQTMIFDQVIGECVSVEGANCFIKPLRNRNVKNCIAGTACSPVSANSNHGMCVSIEEIDEELYQVDSDDSEVYASSSDSPAPPTTTQAISTPTTTGSAGTGTAGTGTAGTGPTVTVPTGTGPTVTTPGTGPTTPEPSLKDECAADDDCKVENSSCNKEEEAEKGTCKCKDDYIGQFGDSKCTRRIGASCTPDDECANNGVCTGEEEKKCTCAADYTETEGYCKANKAENQSCQAKDECIDNASCVLDDSSVYRNGTCKCDTNKPANDDNTVCSATANIINFTLFALLVSSTYVINKFNH